jgi:parvulin-like peptidyl-prolyl isomerase
LAEAKTGDFEGFDVLVKEYNQEDGSKDYPNGYYVYKNTAYEAIEVIEEVLDMKVGEVRKIRSDYGIHIIMRYELEDAAYTREENEDLFISTKTGTYVFMDELVDELLMEYVKEYKERITVDESLYKTVDIKSVEPNYYY